MTTHDVLNVTAMKSYAHSGDHQAWGYLTFFIYLLIYLLDVADNL